MNQVETLSEAFVDQLKDLYSAENQLLKALPKMAKKASNPRLQNMFRTHIDQTQNQIERLNEISQILREKLSGKPCKAMEGLIEEGKEVLEQESDHPALIDALLIGAARRVEHYEVAAYKTARATAMELGLDEAMSLLDETLAEESETDKKLASLLEKEVLPEASDGGEMSDEMMMSDEEVGEGEELEEDEEMEEPEEEEEEEEEK